MTKETIKSVQDKINVMQAFIEGKEIESRHVGLCEWAYSPSPLWQWGIYEYRIKPRYRAFNNTDEMYNSMKQHGVKVRDKVHKEWNFILFNSDLVYIYIVPMCI